MSSSACRSCGAAIIWERTPAGKAMPLDAAPTPLGNVIIEDGRAVVRAGDDLEAARRFGRTLWMPHHATCPHGRGWRR